MAEEIRIRNALALCKFEPRDSQRKYALVIQGPGNAAAVNPSIDYMLSFLAVDRQFDGVICLATGSQRQQLFAHATLPLRRSNLIGVLDELVHQTTEHDLVFAAFFGETSFKDGHLYYALSGESIPCKDIAVQLRKLPSFSVDYVTTAGMPGRLAQYLATMTHPDLGEQRHIGISPVQPRHPLPSEGYSPDGKMRVITPFHWGFFDRNSLDNSVLGLFESGARYQEGRPYILHGHAVNPAQLSL